MEDATARVTRLTEQLAGAVPTWSLAPQVQALQSLRGVSLVVASTQQVVTAVARELIAFMWEIDRATVPAA